MWMSTASCGTSLRNNSIYGTPISYRRASASHELIYKNKPTTRLLPVTIATVNVMWSSDCSQSQSNSIEETSLINNCRFRLSNIAIAIRTSESVVDNGAIWRTYTRLPVSVARWSVITIIADTTIPSTYILLFSASTVLANGKMNRRNRISCLR